MIIQLADNTQTSDAWKDLRRDAVIKKNFQI